MVRAAQVTRAPSSAKTRAMVAPIPRLAPVTMQCLPSSLPMVFPLSAAAEGRNIPVSPEKGEGGGGDGAAGGAGEVAAPALVESDFGRALVPAHGVAAGRVVDAEVEGGASAGQRLDRREPAEVRDPAEVGDGVAREVFVN